MSDDLLERATAALRDTTGTPPDDAARQRAKLLAQAAKRTRPTPIWQWAAVAFGGLFVSSAMAQLGGYMPMIMRAFTRDDAPAAATDKPHNARKASPPSAAPIPPQPSAATPEAPTPSAAPDSQPPSAATPDNPPPSAAASAGPSHAKPSHPALAPKRAPAPSDPHALEPEPEPESESESTPAIPPQPSAAKPNAPPRPESADLALFRRAQKLHLAHSPDALAAWDAYLRVAKQGALVPEARYNRALCLVWLHHYDDARAALEPFAEGKYKGYRQAEAKALLARVPH